MTNERHPETLARRGRSTLCSHFLPTRLEKTHFYYQLLALAHCHEALKKNVIIFVTRQDRNGEEGTGMYGLNGTLQDLGIAN